MTKGERVGIWSPNCAQWTVVQYATAKIGAILVNINPSYRTHELEFVLKQAGISAIFLAESFKTSDYVAMLDEVRPAARGSGTPTSSGRSRGTRCWPGPTRSRRSRWPRCSPG